jgi:hypothetical protein
MRRELGPHALLQDISSLYQLYVQDVKDGRGMIGASGGSAITVTGSYFIDTTRKDGVTYVE